MSTRSYILDRSGDEPAILPANEDNKVRVFHTIEEAERNIENLAEGEIVATDNDTEDSSTIPPNILKYIRDQNELDGWEARTTTSTTAEVTFTAEYDGYVSAVHAHSTNVGRWSLVEIFVNGVLINGIYIGPISNWGSAVSAIVAIKKGDTVRVVPQRDNGDAFHIYCNYYKKRDYTGR